MVYGLLVLGGLKELPYLIERRRVNRVIIVSELLPESRVAVQEIAARSGVRLSEWEPAEHEISLSQKGSTPLKQSNSKCVKPPSSLSVPSSCSCLAMSVSRL